MFVYNEVYIAEGVSVGHTFVRVFVRVFARVFEVVFVWVGLCITWFNLGRLDQAPKGAFQVCYKEYTIPDLHMHKTAE